MKNVKRFPEADPFYIFNFTLKKAHRVFLFAPSLFVGPLQGQKKKALSLFNLSTEVDQLTNPMLSVIVTLLF